MILLRLIWTPILMVYGLGLVALGAGLDLVGLHKLANPVWRHLEFLE